MTRREEIYDLKRLLSGSGIADDSRLSDNHLGFLIDQHRAREIRETFKRNPVIEPIWLQDYGMFQLSKVNKSEDANIVACDCSLAKAVLPPVVSITENLSNISDLGTYRISSACGTYKYEYMNIDKFALVSSNKIMNLFKYFTKVGNAIYLPLIDKARALLVLDSPLDGYVNDNTYKLSGDLIVGTSYTVALGSINHNSIVHQQGQSFTAVNKVFTGSGKVQLTLQKRRMTNDDPYPMSHTMGEIIKMKILTQDFGVGRQNAEDKRNDSTDNAGRPQ